MTKNSKKRNACRIALIVVLVVIFVLALGGFAVIKSYLCQINRTYDQDISETISPKEEYFEVDETDENGDETIDPGSDTELDDKGDSDASDEIAFIAPDDVEWDFIERIEDDKLINILLVVQDRQEGESRQRSDTMIMAVLLGSGDAFHLVPRAAALCTTGLENFTVQLGLGKWITSITMTIF